MIYQDEYPSVDMWSSPDSEFIMKQVLTKFTEWRYESEFRVMTLNPEGFYKHITAPSVFRSITFGSEISDEARKQVIEATRPKLSHIKFEQAHLGGRTFSVAFEDYQIDH